MTLTSLIIFFATAGVLALLAYRFLSGKSDSDTAWRPPELKNAKLVMIEKDLFTRNPYAIAGRPDRVFQLQNRLLMPVEYKTRNYFRVHLTDIAEISMQAWLLRKTGRRTAEYGYITIRHRQTHERRSLPVDLWDDRRCEAMIQRYLDITNGRRAARKCDPRRCKGCGHRSYC